MDDVTLVAAAMAMFNARLEAVAEGGVVLSDGDGPLVAGFDVANDPRAFLALGLDIDLDELGHYTEAMAESTLGDVLARLLATQKAEHVQIERLAFQMVIVGVLHERERAKRALVVAADELGL